MRQLSTRDQNDTEIKLQVTVRSSTMSKAYTAQSAIKGPDKTMYNNSNEKTNGRIYVKKINEKQICNT